MTLLKETNLIKKLKPAVEQYQDNLEDVTALGLALAYLDFLATDAQISYTIRYVSGYYEAEVGG